MAVWATCLRPRSGNFVFLGALIANLLPIIFVRGYAHYLQLAAPWAILLAAELCRTAGERFVDSQSGERIMATAISLPIVPLLMLSAFQALKDFEQDMMAEQSAFAREIEGRLPEKDNVLIINADWLYLLANVNPPYLNYRFVQRPEDSQGILGAAEYAVLMPYRKFDQKEAREWLEREQFMVFDTLEWRGRPVYLLRR